jgi:hypothetical protein
MDIYLVTFFPSAIGKSDDIATNKKEFKFFNYFAAQGNFDKTR